MEIDDRETEDREMGDCERGWEIGNRETNRETNLQS